MGSEAHCFFGRERTAEATTSCVTDRKSKKTQSVDVKLVAAVLEVAARMSETFLSKKLWKASALISSLPCGRPRPSSVLIDFHSCLGLDRCSVIRDFQKAARLEPVRRR